jgi:hypothetical protein
MQSRAPSTTKLFELSKDGWQNWMLHAGFDDWRSYAFCYRRAAEALGERFPVPDDSPEAMFLPTLYLYRHYVEISLKGILFDTSTAFSLEITAPQDHNLNDLWQQARTHLGGRSGFPGTDWLDRAGELIDELNRIDPGSMHFRYPVSKKGARLLTPGFRVSTPRVREAMNDLCFVLDDIAGYLSAIIDFETLDDGHASATA